MLPRRMKSCVSLKIWKITSVDQKDKLVNKRAVKNNVSEMEIKMHLGDIKVDVWLTNSYFYNFFLYLPIFDFEVKQFLAYVIQRLTLILGTST